jgi:hypothetical protein
VTIKHGLLAALVTVAVALVPATSTAEAPIARAATCADYTNQAAAQDAADTRYPDSDGVYCVIYSRWRRVAL